MSRPIDLNMQLFPNIFHNIRYCKSTYLCATIQFPRTSPEPAHQQRIYSPFYHRHPKLKQYVGHILILATPRTDIDQPSMIRRTQLTTTFCFLKLKKMYLPETALHHMALGNKAVNVLSDFLFSKISHFELKGLVYRQIICIFIGHYFPIIFLLSAH